MKSDGEVSIPIGIGFPMRPEDRARLRDWVGEGIPQLVPGTIELPCAKCQMPLGVGPRLQQVAAGGIRLLCPWCLVKFGRDFGLTREDFGNVIHLGNPDSKLVEEDQ